MKKVLFLLGCFSLFALFSCTLSNIADVDVQCDLIADHGNDKYELNQLNTAHILRVNMLLP